MSRWKQAVSMIKHSFFTCKKNFNQKHMKDVIRYRNPIRLNSVEQPNGYTYEDYFDKVKDVKYFNPNVKEPLRSVSKALDFISMSPDRIDDHKATYVIDQKPKPINFKEFRKRFPFTKKVILNENDRFLNGIFLFWLKKAKKLVKTVTDNLSESEHESARKLCKYLILGQPGMGKTALLNYIFSINVNLLRKNKVIWIRVDLNNIENVYLSLRNRLNSKFLRIFCKFYLLQDKYPEFNLSFVFDLEKYLLDYVHNSSIFSKISQPSKNELVNKYSKMLLALKESSHKEIDHIVYYLHYEMDHDYANHLIDKTIEFVQKKSKYGYIFMFDGLDSVTIDFIQYNLFGQWLQEIQAVANNLDKSYKAVYLITMRDYSYIKFQSILQRNKSSHPGNPYDFKILKMKPQDTQSIIDKKLLLARTKAAENGNEITKKSISNIRDNLYLILYKCITGISFEKLNGIPFHQIYAGVNEIFSYNYRALMRLFRELIFVLHSIMKESTYSLLINDTDPDKNIYYSVISGSEWLIYRLLLYGDIGYNVYKNRVQYYDGETHIENENKSIIPNIFNFNDDLNGNNSLSKSLCKLRVMQYLKYYGEENINRVLDWLNKTIEPLWDIEKELRYETRELIYSGVICPNIDYFFIAKDHDSSSYNVKLNGLYNLVFRMLDESIYYETIIDDTPLEKECTDKMQPLNRLDIGISRKDYLMRKSKSVFYFLAYLMKIERHENKLIRERTKIPKEDIKKYFYIFDDQRTKNLRDSFASYLFGYMKSIPDQQIRQFIDEWFDFFDVPQSERNYYV